MSTVLKVTGRCTHTEDRSGWTTFHVEHVGSAYPLRLATKKPEVADQARAVGAKVAEWSYTESESSKINENTGRPYMNRYLEAIEVVDDATAGGSPQPAHRPVSQGDKDRSITRMAVLKAASDLYAGTGDVDAVFKAATRMETWVYRDIDPVPFDSPLPLEPGDAPIVVDNGDDDIPF